VANYNRIASFYDFLSFIFFGNKLIISQSRFFKFIKEGDKVLILGGGTGKLLESIPAKCHITFIDSSAKMLEQARLRKTKSKVVFYQLRFEEYVAEEKFDHCICPYFLDLFLPNELPSVISRIKSFVKDGSFLHVSDFNPHYTTKYNIALMWCMLKFFKITTSLKPKKYNGLFELLSSDAHLNLKDEASWRTSFVHSKIYQCRLF
jgi:ubiquinone/menaquinone biosynthesis C-methylase UbiE